MAQKADIGSKRLISLAPDAWLQWVTGLPQITSLEFLSADFQWISREGDVLQKAFLPQQGEFLVLTELQLRFDRRMPQRMRLYAALAEERYGLLTYPVLVNILPPPRNASTPSFYQSELLGLRAIQDFRVINLWEIDADLVLQQPLPTLLPFVPILQGGNQPAKVARAVQLLRNQDQLRDLEPLLAFFAGFVLETQIIQEIMRWDMEILRESPWYNQMIQEGLQQGLQQGLQEGLQQGLQQGRLAAVKKSVVRLLGVNSQSVPRKLDNLSIDQLEELQDRVFDFTSIADLENWLESQVIENS